MPRGEIAQKSIIDKQYKSNATTLHRSVIGMALWEGREIPSQQVHLFGPPYCLKGQPTEGLQALTKEIELHC